jgi:hypothetical protein
MKILDLSWVALTIVWAGMSVAIANGWAEGDLRYTLIWMVLSLTNIRVDLVRASRRLSWASPRSSTA